VWLSAEIGKIVKAVTKKFLQKSLLNNKVKIHIFVVQHITFEIFPFLILDYCLFIFEQYEQTYFVSKETVFQSIAVIKEVITSSLYNLEKIYNVKRWG